MNLRRGLLVVAGLSFVAAVLLIGLGRGSIQAAGVYLLLESVFVALAVLYEHFGYHPKAPNPAALRPTGERMLDPTSGVLVEVWEDPATGVREYRPVAEGSAGP